MAFSKLSPLLSPEAVSFFFHKMFNADVPLKQDRFLNYFIFRNPIFLSTKFLSTA